MQDSPVVLVSVFLVSSVVLLVVLLYLAYLALRWTIRGFVACSKLGSHDPLVRLIALALAVWVFPQPISYLLDVVPEFIKRAISIVPVLIGQSPANVTTLCPTGTSTVQCIGYAASAWFSMWSTVVTRLFEAIRLSELPLLATVFLLATWAGIARVADGWFAKPHVVSRLRSAASAFAHSFRAGLRSMGGWFGRIPRSVWQNTLLLIVLTIAGYLSVAAIVAIPYLQTQAVAPADVSADNLRERLSKSTLTKEQYDTRWPENLFARDPFTDIKLPPGPVDMESDPTRAAIVKIVGDQRRNREAATKAWTDLRNMAFERQADLLQTAVSAYAVGNLARKGVREQVEHFMNIDWWFRAALDDQESRLQKCRESIAGVDSKLFALYPQLVAVMSVRNEAAKSAIAPMAGMGVGAIAEAWAKARELCEPVYAGTSVPSRPELGAYLGAFGVVARWLVRTESLPLALITGLLGFGLLGAACSTFVRSGVRKGAKEPLIDDLPSVLIRGGAAAMVVFLAVYGGLAIYTTGSAEPNPYVVLFTCLVAAVFSETVWDWAHQRLRSELTGAGGGRGGRETKERKNVARD